MDHQADIVRLQEVKVVFSDQLFEYLGAYPCLVPKYLLQEAYIIVIKYILASFIQDVQLVVWRYKFRASLIAPHGLMLLIESVDDSLEAYATHHRYEGLNVAVLATDLLFKARLQESVEVFGSGTCVTLAVKDAQQAELIDTEGQLCIFLQTFILSKVVVFILEVHEDVVLHEQAPIEAILIV